MTLPADSIEPITRPRVVDEAYAVRLQGRFGIPTAFVLRALKGEPRQRAVALCRLATRYQEANGTLLMLTRRFGRGRARRQRTAATPPRGHGEVSPVAVVDRSGRGYGTRRPDGVVLDRAATRPGVG